MPFSPKDRKSGKILILKARLIYIILRLFTWGALFLGSRIVKRCSDDHPILPPDPIPATVVRKVEIH
jgi:hypothetical protein